MKQRKVLTRFVSFVIATILLCSMGMPCFAAENESRVVRVACGMNDILYLNGEGEPEGVGLPYIRQLAWNNNWTIEYVEGSYNESLQKLDDGEIDLMFPVGKEEDPNGKLLYSEYNVGFQQIGLFAREDADIFYEDFEGFDQKKVGLSIGSNSEILDQYAKKNGFSYKKVSLNSMQDKMNALENGDVDLVAFSTLNTVPNGKLVALLDQLPFYICTYAGNQELFDEINSGMSEMMVHTPEIASELYKEVLVGKTPISYTREENEKIEQANTITFGVYSDRLPLAGIDSEGNCVGIYVDILNEIADESGLTIEIVPIQDSNRLYSYIDDGTVDFVVGEQELRFSQENADNHLSSNHLTDNTTVAVTNPDFELDQANDITVSLTEDRTYLESVILEWFPNATIDYKQTRRECLDSVLHGKSDATFLNVWEFSYEKKNARYENMREWENYRFVSGPTLGASRDSDLEILSILEKTIGKITATRITDIITTNQNNPYQTYTLGDRFYAVRKILFACTAFIMLAMIALILYVKAKRKYIRQLEEANQTKSEFLSRMSHELRTPLNAINGYSTAIEDNLQQPNIDYQTTAKNLQSIHRAVQYQLSIIGDLLDIQQIESGKIIIHPKEVEIDLFMDNLVAMIKSEAQEKSIEFCYNKASNLNAVYQFDEIRFQQVLLNLLHNAVKFTPEGGKVSLSLEVKEKQSGSDLLCVAISDTGIGMSEEFQKTKLFQRFAQEYQGNTSPYEGCGTGLEISKEIMNIMGGNITCESQKGVGSTFYIEVPFPYGKERKTRRKRSYNFQNLQGVQVLLCEDNKMNQDMERRLLEKMKCEVEVAEDGAIGLDKYLTHEAGYYNIILMDIRMPNMDGWECCKKIRESSQSDAKTIPILAVSANAFEEDKKHSLEVGMNEHLSKPVDAKKLNDKLIFYCKNNQLTDNIEKKVDR